jgi:hypothetical protein
MKEATMKRKLVSIAAMIVVTLGLASVPAQATGDNTCGISPQPAISGQTAHVHGDGFNPGRVMLVDVNFPNGNGETYIDVTANAQGSFHFDDLGIENGQSGLGTGTVQVRNHNGDLILCGPTSFEIKGSL